MSRAKSVEEQPCASICPSDSDEEKKTRLLIKDAACFESLSTNRFCESLQPWHICVAKGGDHNPTDPGSPSFFGPLEILPPFEWIGNLQADLFNQRIYFLNEFLSRLSIGPAL